MHFELLLQLRGFLLTGFLSLLSSRFDTIYSLHATPTKKEKKLLEFHMSDDRFFISREWEACFRAKLIATKYAR